MYASFIAVTELPVECPDFTDTAAVDPTTGTYVFTQPSFGGGNVTDLPGSTYFPHGDGYNVGFSIADGSLLNVGSHQLIVNISDTELFRTCSNTITVVGWYSTVANLEGSAAGAPPPPSNNQYIP